VPVPVTVSPEWNCWHWVGGWRESDDELVLSLWLRHEVEE
jgi:hypothetical protein